MNRLHRPFATASLIILIGGLIAPSTLVAQESLTSQLVGRWEMEDVYTLQTGGPEGLRVESHPAGAFTFALELLADGTGSLDGEPLAWSVDERDGAMLWRFTSGASVRMLPRFLGPNRALVLAVSPRGTGPVAAVSSIRRSGR